MWHISFLLVPLFVNTSQDNIILMPVIINNAEFETTVNVNKYDVVITGRSFNDKQTITHLVSVEVGNLLNLQDS